ncbi:minor capsid protein [Pseudomonas juntendi]|uniref:minor capsid protein n=2 Tax=Pseudomonas juntendi TaxID=2666183 RepID=UPI0018D6D107|nr:minor capsid protein [Pseudomonas juntendi]MBH3384700.1 minor capsid protein [Pseudomonas juntendi]
MVKITPKKAIARQIQLRGQYTRIARGAVAQLYQLRAQVAEELQDGLKRSSMLTIFQSKARLRKIDRAIDDQYSAMERDLVDELTQLYKAQTDWNSEALELDLGGAQTSEDFIRSFVESDPFDGKLLREWVTEQSLATQNAVKRAVRLGVVNGLPVSKIVDAVVSDPVNPFNASRRNVEILVRTAAAHVTANADLLGFREAGVEQYQLSAILDTRTTLICASLNGKKFRVNDPKKKVPPFHPGCRTTMIAMFDPDDEPVPDSFDDFLKNLDEEDQVKVLGATRHRMWKKGMPLDGFIDQDSTHVIPLNQLQVLLPS